MKRILLIVFILGTAVNLPAGINENLITDIKENDEEKGDKLFKEGSDVNAKDDDSRAPLMTTSDKGRLDIAVLLIGGNKTPLMIACGTADAFIVKQLLAKGADVNAAAANGNTSLMIARAQDYPGIVNHLKTAGDKKLWI